MAVSDSRTKRVRAKEFWLDTIASSYVLATAYTGLGAAGLFGSALLPDGILTTTLETISAVVLGIGLISFPYELFLRRKLSEEILRAVEEQAAPILQAVELDATLRASGLKRIHRQPVSWDAFYGDPKIIRLIPATPTDQWTDAPEWEAALELATRQVLEIQVFIPRPNAQASDALAQRLEMPPADAARRLEDLQIKLGDQWSAAESGRPPLRAGCHLKVFQYDGLPTVGLVLCTDHYAVVMPPLIGAPTTTRPITFEFGTGTDGFFTSWFENQLNLSSVGQVDDKRVS